MKKFYVTTPIYYPNDVPHIGHAYASFICDVLARYKRLLGYQVKFSTGTDENSQKIIQKATEQGRDVMEFLDFYAGQHQKLWDALQISYTDFIRTSSDKHKAFVQSVLERVAAKGLGEDNPKADFYQAEYVGLYCVGCEGFKKETDLTPDGLCPDHKTKPDRITEKNRFFKLKKYQKQLEDFYAKNPSFVTPAHRFNEVLSFCEQGLEDFSISRQSNTFGIPLPFDQSQVTYVWYDALLNYITACQGGEEEFWPADVHVLGKDIIRFHAIFWPAMLMSVGFELPKKCLVTGHFTADGQKMSKSLGNVVKPLEVIEKYGRDSLVFYLLSDLAVGSDGDFSQSRLHDIHNSMLIGGRGNLVSRVIKLAQKNEIQKARRDKTILNQWLSQSPENNLLQILVNSEPDHTSKIENTYLDDGKFQQYLKDWYVIVQKSNEYMQSSQPWDKIKNGNIDEGKNDLAFLLSVIKDLALLSSPFLIEGFRKIQVMLGNNEFSSVNIDDKGPLTIFEKVLHMDEFVVELNPENLYSRVE